MPLELKTIGASGQISLGKQYAGKTVVVDHVEEGVWVIKTAQVIPDNEMWLHRPADRDKLTRAIKRAERTPARASNLDQLAAKLKRKFQ